MNLETAVGMNREPRKIRENEAGQEHSLAKNRLTQEVNTSFGSIRFLFAYFAVSTAEFRMKRMVWQITMTLAHQVPRRNRAPVPARQRNEPLRARTRPLRRDNGPLWTNNSSLSAHNESLRTRTGSLRGDNGSLPADNRPLRTYNDALRGRNGMFLGTLKSLVFVNQIVSYRLERQNHLTSLGNIICVTFS
jgi:hypothetical protein